MGVGSRAGRKARSMLTSTYRNVRSSRKVDKGTRSSKGRLRRPMISRPPLPPPMPPLPLGCANAPIPRGEAITSRKRPRTASRPCGARLLPPRLSIKIRSKRRRPGPTRSKPSSPMVTITYPAADPRPSTCPLSPTGSEAATGSAPRGRTTKRTLEPLRLSRTILPLENRW